MAKAINLILTPAGEAGHLNTSKRTVDRLTLARKTPACRDGGKWRFSGMSISGLIKQQSLHRPVTGRGEFDFDRAQTINGER